MTAELLVVAGEASGDRIAGLVARATAAAGVHAYGVGGPACRAAGVDTVADTESLSAMGFADVVARAPALATAGARLIARTRETRPRAALLVNFTELNQRLGRALRARGVRVLWCVAPQVWAWRAGRLRELHASCDRLAVILPFEEPLWRGAGYDARFVGHPALEAATPPRAELRARLAIAPDAPAIAVLPGSRPAEIARLAPALAAAAALVRGRVAGAELRLILAPALPARARAACARVAREHAIPCVEGDADHGAAPLLAAFDVALCASGTASLEAALAGAAPVVAYRLDALSFALARRLVRIPDVALPNVLLGRRAFPELLQDDVTSEKLAAATVGLLGRARENRALAEELRRGLAAPEGGSFGERVAALLLPWFA